MFVWLLPGAVLRNDVVGRIMMKCLLSDMPELRLGLNDKIEDITFHQVGIIHSRPHSLPADGSGCTPPCFVQLGLKWFPSLADYGPEINLALAAMQRQASSAALPSLAAPGFRHCSSSALYMLSGQ